MAANNIHLEVVSLLMLGECCRQGVAMPTAEYTATRNVHLEVVVRYHNV